MLVTFVLALSLENAKGDRFTLIVALFAIFFVWLHLKEILKDRNERLLPYSFTVDILLLVMLDEASKYLVNYYFNVYYFYVLISAGFILKRKSRLIVSFAVVSAAFIKYYKFIEAVFLEPKPSNIPFVVSYIFFTFMVFVTVAVFFNYSRMLSEEKAELDRLNSELLKANSLLEEKNTKIKELTIFEERNRIAREIHDSVGHNLTGLIMNLDFCEKLTAADPAKVKAQVSKSREIAKDCLSEIRRSVKALKPVVVESLTLIKSLEELIVSSREKFGINIDFRTHGDIYFTRPEFNIAVYRACQEAITNSVKHGKATYMEVDISFGVSEFCAFIKDNGTGAKELIMGTGLTGMVERLKEFNGNVSFYKNNGFMINISVPLEGILNE